MKDKKSKERGSRKKHNHKRIGDVISIGDVLPHISEQENKKKMFNNIKVRICSMRLQMFKEKGTDCVQCGLKGLYFAIEKDKGGGSYHLNLYGVDDSGDEVLMTKDHIKPKSRGGPDSLDNLQPMCKCCNEDKGNS